MPLPTAPLSRRLPGKDPMMAKRDNLKGEVSTKHGLTLSQPIHGFIWVFPKIGVVLPPKSSMLIGFLIIINHRFWGTHICGLTPISFVGKPGGLEAYHGVPPVAPFPPLLTAPKMHHTPTWWGENQLNVDLFSFLQLSSTTTPDFFNIKHRNKEKKHLQTLQTTNFGGFHVDKYGGFHITSRRQETLKVKNRWWNQQPGMITGWRLSTKIFANQHLRGGHGWNLRWIGGIVTKSCKNRIKIQAYLLLYM